MRDMRAHGIEMLTIGQYLQPTPDHLPVLRYVHPDTFAMFEREALRAGLQARCGRCAGALVVSRRPAGARSARSRNVAPVRGNHAATFLRAIAAIALAAFAIGSARAEVSAMRISRGFGVLYLPLMVMEARSWSRSTRRPRDWAMSRPATSSSTAATSSTTRCFPARSTSHRSVSQGS